MFVCLPTCQRWLKPPRPTPRFRPRSGGWATYPGPPKARVLMRQTEYPSECPRQESNLRTRFRKRVLFRSTMRFPQTVRQYARQDMLAAKGGELSPDC